MADIATISLKADTSDLERGTQKLKEFGDTAERVSDASRDLNDQFNRGIDHQKLASEAIKQQKKELDDLLNSINPTNKAFDALDKATQKLVEANRKGLLPKDQFADYNAILEQTRDKLTRVNMSLTAEGMGAHIRGINISMSEAILLMIRHWIVAVVLHSIERYRCDI